MEFEGNDSLANRLLTRRRELAEHFVDIFQRLLKREKVDFIQEDLGLVFEVAATILFARSGEKKDTGFDGADDLSSVIRKANQVEFIGKMWILDVSGKSYNEPFKARVTDKRVTKQGIEIVIWVGSNKAEGNLSSAFGLAE